MAEDYRKGVEVGDLVTRNRRTSTKLKSSNTLARNRTVGSFLVNHTFIKMACGTGIDYRDQNHLAVTSNLNCSVHVFRGLYGFVCGNIFYLSVQEDSLEGRLKIERENMAS